MENKRNMFSGQNMNLKEQTREQRETEASLQDSGENTGLKRSHGFGFEIIWLLGRDRKGLSQL